jgi:hypothetical protein
MATNITATKFNIQILKCGGVKPFAHTRNGINEIKKT